MAYKNPTPKSSNRTTNKAHNNVSDTQLERLDLSLDGKLITSSDGILLGQNDFQVLTNYEYTDASIRSVSGMTKINSAAPSTYIKHRSLFQYVKTNPNESHLLAQSYNSGLTACAIQQMTQEVPSTGNFSSTLLYTIATTWTANTAYVVGDKIFPTTSNGRYYVCSKAGTSHGTTEPTWGTTEFSTTTDNTIKWVCRIGDLSGTFSKAPDDCMIFTNGEDALIWGGDEYRVGKFINYDPAELFSYDYTDRINNSSGQTSDIATLTPTVGGIDSSTELLCHFDDNLTDSSSNGFTVTSVAAAAYTTGKFTKGYVFDGAADVLTIPDNAVFDFSGGSWSVDMWYDADTLGTDVLYYQGIIATPTNDYMMISLTATGAINFKIVAGGVTLIDNSTGAAVITAASGFQHIEVTESGDNFYIFVGGVLKAFFTSASRPANYDGVVCIGAKSDYNVPTYSDFADGTMDELRISSRARHTANFDVMTAAYGSDSKTYAYVLSMLPISGMKFYIAQPNASTCAAPTINYWNGSAWTSVGTVTDNTLSGGISMAGTGTMTFASTANTAKQKMINNMMGYWYQIYWTALDDTTKVYYMTLKTPMQKIVDVWDGEERTCASLMYYTTSYIDYTTNVLEIDAETYYDGTSWLYLPETYLPIGSCTSAYAVYAGFLDRQTGLSFLLPDGQVNSNASTPTVYYWNGAGWSTVGTIDDQTASAAGATLSTSGYYIWNPIDEANEFKTSVSTSTMLYYYKIVFSATLHADTKIDNIGGIAAPIYLTGYNASATWLNSLWLIGNKNGWKSELRSTMSNTMCVFNSNSCWEMFLGGDEELITGCSLFSRFVNNIEETLLVFKKNEIWVLDGSDLSDIRPYKVSSQYGITAKNTLAVCNLGVELSPGVNKAVAMWQSNNSIMMFDNGSLITVSDDIDNYFTDMYDTNVTERINPDAIEKSYSFFDPLYKTYHWLFAAGTSTTLNRELVFDIVRKKWYRIDRTSGLYLQLGLYVKDLDGNSYTYGGIDTGYIERLNYGNTFDGTDITSTFRLSDKPLDNTAFLETDIRFIKIIGICSSSAATVTLYAYSDTGTTATTLGTVDQSQTGYRVYQRPYGVNQRALFHSFGAVCVSNDAAHAFSPLAIALLHHNIRFQTNRRET